MASNTGVANFVRTWCSTWHGVNPRATKCIHIVYLLIPAHKSSCPTPCWFVDKIAMPTTWWWFLPCSHPSIHPSIHRLFLAALPPFSATFSCFVVAFIYCLGLSWRKVHCCLLLKTHFSTFIDNFVLEILWLRCWERVWNLCTHMIVQFVKEALNVHAILWGL